MDTEYSFINNIAPGDTNWKSKIVVLEKTGPKVGKNGKGKYQHLWLMDSMQTKVQATIFSDLNIKALQDTLTPLKTYSVSKVVVKIPADHIKANVGNVQWIISGASRITDIDDDYSGIAEAYFTFTPFDQLHQFVHSEADIGVAGVVVNVGPTREIQNAWNSQSIVQHIVLLDEKLQAITLTLWDSQSDGDQLADLLMKRTILVANHVKVSLYNGISLSTKSGTTLQINPVYQKLSSLTTWATQCSEMLLQIISQQDYVFINPSTITSPSQNKFTSIIQVSNPETEHPEGSKFWVNGLISLLDNSNPLWYMSCGFCKKGSTGNLHEIYRCNYCRQENSTATPRARCIVEVEDDTGKMRASMIGPPAEQFLGTSSIDLMNPEHTIYSTHADPYHSKYGNISHSIQLKNGTPDPTTGDARFTIIYVIENENALPTPSESPIQSTDLASTETPSTPPVNIAHATSAVRKTLDFNTTNKAAKKKSKSAVNNEQTP